MKLHEIHSAGSLSDLRSHQDPEEDVKSEAEVAESIPDMELDGCVEIPEKDALC